MEKSKMATKLTVFIAINSSLIRGSNTSADVSPSACGMIEVFVERK